MRKLILPWAAGLGAAVSLVSTSCTYEPTYYSSLNSGYYDDNYHGGGSFSTSVFIATGDPRWGYDPHSYCYYDYHSRRYYDPYLYGYYPVGHRPTAVYGVPHPHGWRPGHRYCPPPTRVRNVTVVNYRDRESAYRRTDYSWARQVRRQSSDGTYDRHHRDGSYDGRHDDRGSSIRSRPSESHDSPTNYFQREGRDRRGGWDRRDKESRPPETRFPERAQQESYTPPAPTQSVQPPQPAAQQQPQPQPIERPREGGGRQRLQLPEGTAPNEELQKLRGRLRGLGDA